jgi:hypothetical protein
VDTEFIFFPGFGSCFSIGLGSGSCFQCFGSYMNFSNIFNINFTFVSRLVSVLGGILDPEWFFLIRILRQVSVPTGSGSTRLQKTYIRKIFIYKTRST